MAALPFQGHANFGTWSIDFGLMYNEPIFEIRNFKKSKGKKGR
jgi:hypothetical protein